MKVNDNVYVLTLPSTMNPGEFIHPVVITNNDKVLLVDTGFPGQSEEIKKFIEDEGIEFSKLSSIILTHHDIDHVGSISDIVNQVPNVKVLSSEIEKKYINGCETPTKLAALEKNLNNLPEEARQLYEKMMNFYKCNKVNVDITLSEGDIIPNFENIKVIDTRGHTPGHISLYLEDDKILIAADAFIIKDNELSFTEPELTYNDTMYLESIKKLCNYDIKIVICYHGGVYSNNVNEAIKKLVNKNY